MSTEKFDVQRMGELARIQLTAAETAAFQAQLEQVLGHVERLNRLEVSDVEPTAHSFPLFNIFRADEIRPSLSQAEALANAPHQAHGLFVVTKVLD